MRKDELIKTRTHETRLRQPNVLREMKRITSLANANADEVERIGGKAANLARLTQAGLPVPEGYVISTDIFENFEATADIADEDMRTIMGIIDALGGEVALRSSATVEDGAAVSMAGVFDTHYINKGKSSEEIKALIKKIYLQAKSSEVLGSTALFGVKDREIKLGLIVQRLINPSLSGVIYASSEHSVLTVQYTEGFGANLVDGKTSGSSVLIDTHSGAIQSSVNFDENPIQARNLADIKAATEQIIALFAHTEQDIEFAIDENEQLHILQARTLTTEISDTSTELTPFEAVEIVRKKALKILRKEMGELGLEKGLLHQGNFSELLPTPTQMDIGVFRYIFTGHGKQDGAIQIGRHKMGYPLGSASVGFLQYVGGRAYESLARDAATYYCGFPDTEQEYIDTLVNEYLDKVYADPERAEYPEMGLYLQDPSMNDLVVRFGDEKAARFYDCYKEFKRGIAKHADTYLNEYHTTRKGLSDSFIHEKEQENLSQLSDEELLDSYFGILEHLRTGSCVDFVIAARLGFYYTERLKLLLSSLDGLSSDEAEDLFAELSQGLEGSSITDNNIALCDALSVPEAYRLAQRLVGHYPSEGEALELRHPRLADSRYELAKYVDGIRSSDNYKTKFEEQRAIRFRAEEKVLKLVGVDNQSIRLMIKNAQQYMALRETIKNQFTREYAELRKRLVEIAKKADLPEDKVFYFYPEELKTLLSSPSSIRHLAQSRQVELSLFRDLDMPRVIQHDSTNKITLGGGSAELFKSAKGKLIAKGELVDGIVINLDHDSGESDLLDRIRKIKALGKKVVLAARQVNLTHDPFINAADGLVLQNAGFVSHGAQRARELGVGALSGIDISGMQSGMSVRFDPANKTVEAIGEGGL